MASKPIFFVFIGHDYFGSRKLLKRRYRQSISNALKMTSTKLKFRLVPLYGDTPLSPAIIRAFNNKHINGDTARSDNYWPRIIAYIQLSVLTIMDLRPHTCPAEPLNWNVLLELGVAYGHTTKHIILTKNRERLLNILSNIQGCEIEEPPKKNFEKFLYSRITSRFIGMVNPC